MALSLRQAAKLARVAPSTLLAHLEAGSGPPATFTRSPTGRREWSLRVGDVKRWAERRQERIGGRRG